MRNTIAASSTRQSRLLAALLGCALVLAAVLAWRAYRAVSEQRASVIRQLQDEADYAAFMFATHAGRDVYWGLVDLFAPVTPHNEVRRGGPQVPLASVVNDPCEYDFTCAIRAGARGWFRLDLRSGASERISTSRSGLPAWLLDSIRTRLPEIERPASSPVTPRGQLLHMASRCLAPCTAIR